MIIKLPLGSTYPNTQRLDKGSNSGGALMLKKANFKVIFKIPGGHMTMFSTKAQKFRGGTGPSGPPSYPGAV